MNLEQLIINFGYFGIFILIIINGIISFPSSQIIYLISGYFASKRDLNLFIIILLGTLANTIGNIILYEIARKKGLDYTLKFFRHFLYIKNPKQEIKKIEQVFKKKGVLFLFVGKLLNPIKIFIPIPAGIVKMNRIIFTIIVFITSGIWATIFVSFGFYFGKSYQAFGYYGALIFLIAIIVLYIFYKYMNSEEILKEIEKN